MSKKLYVQVARILRDCISDPSLRSMVALEFIEVFKENIRFDADRFLNATKRYSGVTWKYSNGLSIED